MKKNLTLILVFTTILTFFNSCSSDGDNNNNDSSNSSNSEIIGTWGPKWNDGSGIAVHPKFTFLSNGKVKYYTYPSGKKPELEEIGTFTMNGNIITMNFPETVEIKFKNTVTFISETQFNFEKIQESGYDTWSAESYFKTEDPNLN